MSSLENFSSLPPNEERLFAVYEEHAQAATKQANKMGLIAAGAVAACVFLFALIVPTTDSGEESSEAPAAETEAGGDELGAE